jgi:alpha-glucosidase
MDAAAWTRVTEPGGRPGQWYLHLSGAGQPDRNWRNPAVTRYFGEIIRLPATAHQPSHVPPP